MLPAKVREGDYIEIGNTGAYGRAIAGRFNGYGAFDEAILLDEPMLTMYGDAEAERAQDSRRGATGPGVSAKLEYLPAEESFLDPVRADADNPGAARAVVIPFGLEASVSYGGGTAAGPAAILKASQQLELYDEELRVRALSRLRRRRAARARDRAGPSRRRSISSPASSRRCWSEGKFPFVLGGEHSLTAGAIRPFAARHPDLVVLQLDAHADLRDGYQGERYSHAAAMRRVLDHAGRVAGVGRHPRHLQGRGRVLRGQPRPHRHPLGQGPGALGHRGDRRAAPGPAGLRHVRHRCARCRGHAGDGHADARRALLPAGARHPAAACEVGRVVGADLVEFAPDRRASTPATTRPPRWPTRCCPTRSPRAERCLPISEPGQQLGHTDGPIAIDADGFACLPHRRRELLVDISPHASSVEKGPHMQKLALALLLSAALAMPALAQKKDDPKKDAAKSVAVPTNTFFKGQTPSQYLAKERLIGAKVVNKDGQTVGTIDDLIISQGGQIEGVVMGVGGLLGVGSKQVGVRLGALKITTADGKVTITLPAATKEMLGAVPAYQKAK